VEPAGMDGYDSGRLQTTGSSRPIDKSHRLNTVSNNIRARVGDAYDRDDTCNLTRIFFKIN